MRLAGSRSQYNESDEYYSNDVAIPSGVEGRFGLSPSIRPPAGYRRVHSRCSNVDVAVSNKRSVKRVCSQNSQNSSDDSVASSILNNPRSCSSSHPFFSDTSSGVTLGYTQCSKNQMDEGTCSLKFNS